TTRPAATSPTTPPRGPPPPPARGAARSPAPARAPAAGATSPAGGGTPRAAGPPPTGRSPLLLGSDSPALTAAGPAAAGAPARPRPPRRGRHRLPRPGRITIRQPGPGGHHRLVLGTLSEQPGERFQAGEARGRGVAPGPQFLPLPPAAQHFLIPRGQEHTISR